MLDLNDSKWKTFLGGYNILYDVSEPLKKLLNATSAEEINFIIKELQEELHHQGDVGLASYYAVPHLIIIANQKKHIVTDILVLVITIIIAGTNNRNPKIPLDLKADYDKALIELGEIGISLINREWDLALASLALAALAISKGQINLAKAITILEDDGTLEELLENYE